jgi:hypothetical protein
VVSTENTSNGSFSSIEAVRTPCPLRSRVNNTIDPKEKSGKPQLVTFPFSFEIPQCYPVSMNSLERIKAQ